MDSSNHTPQPFESPEPLESQSGGGLESAVTLGALVLAVGSLGLVPELFFPRRCAGSMRSAHLQWEQRQIEIAQTISETDNATPPAPTNDAAQE